MDNNFWAVEIAFEKSCVLEFKTVYRLKLRRLASNLFLANNFDVQHIEYGDYAKTQNALKQVKANIVRRKSRNNTLTNNRLIDLPDPAKAILVSDIAYIFRDEIDNYTQIDFGKDKHIELLKVAVDISISKVSKKQGRPINEALDEFFIGLKDLYQSATGKLAIASAHFDEQPKTDFEKLVHLGYQIIRPAQEYPSALKAYQRAVNRNS